MITLAPAFNGPYGLTKLEFHRDHEVEGIDWTDITVYTWVPKMTVLVTTRHVRIVGVGQGGWDAGVADDPTICDAYVPKTATADEAAQAAQWLLDFVLVKYGR